MGNYISCTLTTSGGKYCKSDIKVILTNGEIKQFQAAIPIKAAELMLELPNCFLVNTKSLKIGTRFSALNADEDLEMANVYVMFPMKRLNSVVTASDMGALLLTANSAVKRNSGGMAKVLPDSVEVGNSYVVEEKRVDEIKLNLDDIEEFSSAFEYRHRRSFCRSKKPLLETIAEEPVCSR